MFVKWHKEKLQSGEKLEARMRKLGWADLSWHPGHPDREKEVRCKLYGKPPHYRGKYEDYQEEVIMVLIDPKNGWRESGILVRNYLKGSLEELWKKEK
jgi:hypothetical protein